MAAASTKTSMPSLAVFGGSVVAFSWGLAVTSEKIVKSIVSAGGFEKHFIFDDLEMIAYVGLWAGLVSIGLRIFGINPRDPSKPLETRSTGHENDNASTD